jgi:AraC-like DNA-binding protein
MHHAGFQILRLARFERMRSSCEMGYGQIVTATRSFVRVCGGKTERYETPISCQPGWISRHSADQGFRRNCLGRYVLDRFMIHFPFMANAPRVIALVSPRLRSTLRRALPSALLPEGLREARAVLQGSRVDAVFVDPALDECVPDVIVQLRTAFPNAPVVLYTSFEARRFDRLITLIQDGFADIVFSGFDDSPERLHRLLADLSCRGPLDEFARAIAPMVRLLPRRLVSAVDAMFADPRPFRCTLDLASAAGLNKRVVFRHLAAAGFESPRRLVASVRVLRACQLMRDESRSIREIARRLGYRSADQLAEHFAQLVGCTPSTARAMSDAVIVDRVTRAVVAELAEAANV